MTFTSKEFLLFFAVLFILYWFIQRKTFQNLLLLAGSFIFYGLLHPWFAGLLAVSTAADYGLSLGMLRFPQRRRWFLAGSLLVNLGALVFFKYFNFFSNNAAALLKAIDLRVSPLELTILLPVGLSFFTLKKLSYFIDLYRGVGKPAQGWLDYALYVSFFPQIASGPIQRARSLLPQIQSRRAWKAENFYQAWPLVVTGLFKKFVVAGPVAVIVSKSFALQQPSIAILLMAGLGFTLLVLADFSAYTDLSRGISFLLGFDTPENFRSPYLSLTPIEFWNRWHITLSEWLRDYIFYPLRRAALRRDSNPDRIAAWLVPPLVTFLISGFWHGAGWNYIAWGGFWGLLIAVYQRLGLGGAWKPATRLKTFLAWLLMFALTVASWILFRAPSITWLMQVLTRSPFLTGQKEAVAVLVSLTEIAVFASPMVLYRLFEGWFKRSAWLEAFYLAAALAATIVFINSASSDFIYFQF